MSLFSKKQKEEPKEEQVAQEEKVTETLGAKIARLRKEKGYTQEEFSQLLDVTAQAVSKWENDLSCPDIMLLPKIAQLFETSVDELLGRESPRTQNKNVNEAPSADISKLNLRIRVTRENQNPINVSFPLTTVKKFAKLGTGIAGILNVNSPEIDGNKIDSIFNLVDEGVTGELLNVIDESGQHVVIEIS